MKAINLFSTFVVLAVMSLVAFASFSTVAVDAALTVGASGTTSTVTAALTTESFYATLKGKYYPYYSSNTELSTESATSNIILVSRGTGSTLYKIQWNFTQAETATIKTWLDGLAARNNIEVTFTATWDAQGRFAVSTGAWTLTQGSIEPFGMTATCDAVAMVTCLVQLELSLPSDCQNTMIPLVKSCAVAHPECLAIYGKTLNYVHSYCVNQRPIIDTLFCTDGRAGGDAACAFVGNARPSGTVQAEAVVTVDANGFATSGTVGTTPPSSPTSAGAVASFAALISVAVMMMIGF